MVILSVDYGDKRTGVAVCDRMEMLASPVTVIWGDYAPKVVAEIEKIAAEYKIPVCDVYAKWKKMESYGTDTTLLLGQGLNHPTREMHHLFAYSILETMFSAD